MAIIRLTREDILQAKIIEVGDWYKCKVTKASVEPAKTDQSTNFVFFCTVVEGKEAGVQCRASFSEKFLGPFKPFAEACGADVGEDGGSFNNEAFVEKELMIFIEPKESKSDKKIYNTPTAFMSLAAYETSMVSK